MMENLTSSPAEDRNRLRVGDRVRRVSRPVGIGVVINIGIPGSPASLGKFPDGFYMVAFLNCTAPFLAEELVRVDPGDPGAPGESYS